MPTREGHFWWPGTGHATNPIGRRHAGDRYLFGTPMGLFQLEDEGKRTGIFPFSSPQRALRGEGRRGGSRLRRRPGTPWAAWAHALHGRARAAFPFAGRGMRECCSGARDQVDAVLPNHRAGRVRCFDGAVWYVPASFGAPWTRLRRAQLSDPWVAGRAGFGGGGRPPSPHSHVQARRHLWRGAVHDGLWAQGAVREAQEHQVQRPLHHWCGPSHAPRAVAPVAQRH